MTGQLVKKINRPDASVKLLEEKLNQKGEDIKDAEVIKELKADKEKRRRPE